MATLTDTDALLIYRIGPVLCCAPGLHVEAIIEPPSLTQLPGTSDARPGIFKHSIGVISVSDLRYCFGLDRTEWKQPGRMIITKLEAGNIGFWVDEIIDVIQVPASGWGALPPHIPREAFSRTLLLKDKIHLYAEFENLYGLRSSGYLSQYINQLQAAEEKTTESNTPGAESLIKTGEPRKAIQKPEKQDNKESSNVIPLKTVTTTSQSEDKPKLEQQTEKTATVAEVTPLKPAGSPTPAFIKTEKVAVATPSEQFKQLKQPNTNSGTASAPSMTNDTSAQTSHAKTSLHSSPSPQPVERTSPGYDVAGTPITEVKNYKESSVNSRPTQTEVALTKSKSKRAWWGVALVIFLVVGLSGGTYYFYWGKEPLAKKSGWTHMSAKNKFKISFPSGLNNIGGFNKKKIPPTEDVLQKETRPPYQAIIEKDPEGITITLAGPKTEPVLRDNTPTQSIMAQPIVEQTIAKSTTNPVNPAQSKTHEQKLVNISLSIVSKTQEPRTEKLRSTPKIIIHSVVKGDTLWHIAKRYVRNPFRYPELASLSKIKNPDLIYPGDRVRILIENN